MSDLGETVDNYVRVSESPLRAANRYLGSIWAEAKSDSVLYACIGCYALVVGLLALSIGDIGKFRPFLYVLAWLSVSSSSLLLVLAPLVALVIVFAVWRRPTAPFSELWSITKPVLGPRVLAGIFLVASNGVFYGTFTSAKNMLPDIFHDHWDVRLAKADRLIHGGVDPSTYLMSIGGNELTILSLLYGGVWNVLVLGLTALVTLSKAHERIRHQFLLAYFACWIIVGNIQAALFYSGGPCFYGLFTGDNSRFLNLTKSITAPLTLAQQWYLRDFYRSGEIGIGTGISAFPSMHVTAATLIAFLLAALDRRLAWLGLLFVVVTEVGSVRLGWHYAIDGYVGICTAVVVWCVAGKIVSGYRATHRHAA